MHFVNESAFLDTVFAVIRPFMKEKLKQRIKMHGNVYESLHELTGTEVLPTELGGEGGPLEEMGKEWKEKLHSFEDAMVESNKFGMLKLGELGKSSVGDATMAGMVGSFRKLNTD